MKLAHFAPAMSALKTFCGRRVAHRNPEEVIYHAKYITAEEMAERGHTPCK